MPRNLIPDREHSDASGAAVVASLPRDSVSSIDEAWIVGLIVVLAAALRFWALGTKSYWEDEGLTVTLLHQSFGAMLHSLRTTEPDPPGYFMAAWAWARLFGYGEAALRALSAVAGVLTVPLAYVTARRLLGRRPAAIAAALLAANPFLVWYSQEARPYALFALLATASLWCLVDALETPGPRSFTAWTIVSAAMVATHYFGVFLVVGEATWLLATTFRRVRIAWSVVIAAVALIVTGLTLVESHSGAAARADWGGAATLPGRMLAVPGMFLIGFETNGLLIFGITTASLVLVALTLLVGRHGLGQRGVIICASLGLGGIIMPLAAALTGADFFVPRNIIFALVPLWIVIGSGFAAGWDTVGTRIAAAALCLVGCAIVLTTASTPKYHYQDWRAVARVMGSSSGGHVVVMAPRLGSDALAIYLHHRLRVVPLATVRTREIDVIATRLRNLQQLGDPAAPVPPASETPPLGFRRAGFYHRHSFTLLRFEASRAVTVDPPVSALAGFAGERAVVFVEAP